MDKTMQEHLLSELALAYEDHGKAAAHGPPRASLHACQRVVEILRKLALDHAPSYRPALAASLGMMTKNLTELERYEDALAACEEELALERQLVDRDPTEFFERVAMSLLTRGGLLLQLSHEDIRANAEDNGSDLLRAVPKPDPILEFAASLKYLSRVETRNARVNSRRELALASAEEATSLIRRLAATDQDRFRRRLADALRLRTLALQELGRHDEAMSSAREADALRQ